MRENTPITPLTTPIRFKRRARPADECNWLLAESAVAVGMELTHAPAPHCSPESSAPPPVSRSSHPPQLCLAHYPGRRSREEQKVPLKISEMKLIEEIQRR